MKGNKKLDRESHQISLDESQVTGIYLGVFNLNCGKLRRLKVYKALLAEKQGTKKVVAKSLKERKKNCLNRRMQKFDSLYLAYLIPLHPDTPNEITIICMKDNYTIDIICCSIKSIRQQ